MERISYKKIIGKRLTLSNNSFTSEKDFTEGSSVGTCSFIEGRIFTDSFGRKINIVEINNGAVRFTVLLERSMDIGEAWLKETKMSWNRNVSRLLHPDSINIHEDGAWEKGFYQAVASLGPEVFGTPDEIRTPHGTGAYSMADTESVYISHDLNGIEITGEVLIKGYEDTPCYKKKVNISTKINSNYIIRRETFTNLSNERLPLDDGYHIQFNGEFIKDGGRYVLPVSTGKMLLRDSAPAELNPKAIYPENEDFMPIRCYQYVPEKVYGIETIKEFKDCEFLYKEPENTTAEMILNKHGDYAAVVVRPLSSFPRTLLAKRNDGEAMYAIEPSKTRPNSIKQKAIDGELCYIEPKETKDSVIMFAFLDNKDTINKLVRKIEGAASYEDEIAKIRRKEK